MPPLQQSLTISLLRVALWWQKWQRTGDFNTFHVIFGAEMLFFSSFFFLLRRLLAPVKVPSRSFEGAFSLSAPWGGTISSMGWSNKRNGTSLRHFIILHHPRRCPDGNINLCIYYFFARKMTGFAKYYLPLPEKRVRL